MLQVGIIGLGGWGQRLVNATQGKTDKVRFAAAASGRSGKAIPFAEQHGIRILPDVETLLADPSIQAVVSAGPAGLHATHARQALDAGKPVLAIKPMASTKADGDMLAAAQKKSGKLLALGYDRCFYPNVRELRRMVAAGELGKLVHAEGNFCVDRYPHVPVSDWKASPEQITPGALCDHMLYLMIELLGPVAEVTVVATRQVVQIPLADVVAVLLRFKGGQSGLLTAIGVTADVTRLHVFGSNGWAEMRASTELARKGLKTEIERVDLPEVSALKLEMEAFADAVTGTAPFPVSVADAVHSTAVLEAMARSATSGKTEAVSA